MRSADSANPFALLTRALAFAAHKHRDQRRKDAEASPYINHPIALAELLVHEGGIDDPLVLAAALLHDTLEDTETTLDELRAAFGAEIAGIVAEVSDDKSLEKQERKRRQIEHAPQLSARAQLVKLADKTCNLRDVADHPPASWSLERRREYFEWAKAVVDRIRGPHPVLEGVFDAAYARCPSTE
ncbi:MAG TPA: HD domain-containing protein [Candidatus Dormibacteraeota bacterium]|nr:HD domain-containing protein [Candidatus Dormibacteraeota bacterium]